MIRREQICSQQLHCLSCSLSVSRAGRDCRELTPKEIMKLKEENKMSDTDMLHMSALEKKVEQQEQLLRESLPILRRAFFANYQDQDKCDELRDKIGEVVGRKDNENNS